MALTEGNETTTAFPMKMSKNWAEHKTPRTTSFRTRDKVCSSASEASSTGTPTPVLTTPFSFGSCSSGPVRVCVRLSCVEDMVVKASERMKSVMLGYVKKLRLYIYVLDVGRRDAMSLIAS